MKFVDEATIKVQAGNGGRGCLSFRREKFVPFGGPDGGEGGLGGSIYLVAQEGINTLADFRYMRTFRAAHGEAGGGNDRTGHGGDDMEVPVPVGTMIFDADTQEQLADLTHAGERVLVARGGKGGWGNAKFKSSTNRAPRKAMPGLPGEHRTLNFELKLIADVGLLGLPNAGKSTLISAVSAARPRVADYPFTTLHPNLGVVSVGLNRSFVMADIPGLIEGAAEGAGLGIRFLKHLQRTGLLLHLVDISPPDPAADPVADAISIVGELNKFSPELAAKERWLVLNKLDLLPSEDAEKRCKDIVRRLKWKGPLFRISGLARQGTEELSQAVMRRLEELNRGRRVDDDEVEAVGTGADVEPQPKITETRDKGRETSQSKKSEARDAKRATSKQKKTEARGRRPGTSRRSKAAPAKKSKSKERGEKKSVLTRPSSLVSRPKKKAKRAK